MPALKRSLMVYRRNVCVWTSGVPDSIFGDKFATKSRINVPTAHAQILSSQKSPKMVSGARNDHVFIGKWMRRIEMTSDCISEVVIWSKLRMVETAHERSEKSPK